MNHLHNAQTKQEFSGLVDYFKTEQDHYLENTRNFVYEYTE